MKSGCIADNCSATNPRIDPVSISIFPPEKQTILKARGFENASFYQCQYCGTVWGKSINEAAMAKGIIKEDTLEIGKRRSVTWDWYI
jgi:hypothetical protein